MCFRIEQEFENPQALMDDLKRAFGDVVIHEIISGVNIALTNQATVVYEDQDAVQVTAMRFGLVPSWAKEPNSKLGNSRSETAHEKPSFRAAFKRRRCLIPVTGFYEWRMDPGEKRKTPYKVTVVGQDQPVFYLAGLWEFWEPQQLLSFSILTTDPNEFMANLHNRMPVILPDDVHDMWLDPANEEKEGLQAILKPYPAELMAYQAYDRYVSSPGNKDKSQVKPVGEKLTMESGDPLATQKTLL
jgi:putative SOS response-associated peptidase YedK